MILRTKKYLIFRVIIFCYTFFILESKCESQVLKVGDKMSDDQFTIENYAVSKIRFSDFTDKIIILDFWHTGCASCIQAFNHLESLQTSFKEKIQIILVNKESEDSLKRFLAKHKKITLPDLPRISNDSLLTLSYFPHSYFPFQVWLDRNGKVIAKTNGTNATKENIQLAIAGKQINFLEEDFISREDDSKFEEYPPALAEYALRKGILKYYSHLTNSISGFHGTIGFRYYNERHMPTIAQFPSSTILNLYKAAFGERSFGVNRKYDFRNDNGYLPNNIILKTSDSSHFIIPKESGELAQWYADNSYCYELMIPVTSTESIYKLMQEDLRRSFGYKARIEKKNIECWVLSIADPKIKLSSKGGKDTTNWSFSDDTNETRFWNNKSLDLFFEVLRYYIRKLDMTTPFVNAANYHGNVDLVMAAEAFKIENPQFVNKKPDIRAIKNELRKNNIDLVKKKWWTDVLIIEDKD